MVYKNLCILVLWTKVASALEGLTESFPILVKVESVLVVCKPRNLNSLMLTQVKSSLTILMKSLMQSHSWKKYLKGKYYSEHHQLSFKYFVRSFSNPKILSKVS